MTLGADRCGGCGRPLRGVGLSDAYRCGACRRHPPAYERLIALWAFEPPLDAVIHAFKFERLETLGRQLAREMAVRIRSEGLDLDLATWVPLHWRRYLGRGYNQAERIARPLAGALTLPARPTLLRTRATPAQTGLPRGRRAANVRGALRVRRRARVADLSILLVDDVFTTGATLRTAADSLRLAGAARIVAAAAARTPGRDEPYARRGRIC